MNQLSEQVLKTQNNYPIIPGVQNPNIINQGILNPPLQIQPNLPPNQNTPLINQTQDHRNTDTSNYFS